ncbi:MAG TPA: hypothetical protein PK264_16175 [Hyphomicrobiaceae bacterium]|nr:hypothetical protein [Hyphomicrobiaceae bacterium]
MMKKIATGAIALTMAGALVVASATEADARRGRRVAGILLGTAIGLGIAGAYAYGPRHHYRGGHCYLGEQRCRVVGQKCWYDRYRGHEVCKDDVRCWRPQICD